ncbi:MAG: HAD hydrolase-like protein [Lachnospiraceae bacterium]|nr:HAD hydrolase-like protein [Lachnospiraceae bacterium]
MKKYLLFDLDGTLTDPMIGITSCVQYALQAFGIEEPDLQKLTPFIGPPLRESFMKFYGFDEQQAEAAVAKYRERFQDIGIFENEVYAGIPRMLHTLQSKGMFLAVASSKPQVYVERILEHFDLKKYFKVVVGSELDGTRERKDEVVLEALNRLFAYKPIQKNQVYMIGDRSYDVAGARVIGIESVGVTYGFGDMEELKEAKADYIVRSVEELEKFLLRGVDETQPADQKKGLTFADIWVMLYVFLLFMAVRSIVMYVVDLLCIQLWGAQLPPAIDRLLFDRSVELPEGVELAFAADQIVIKSALGFVGGALAIRREAARWIAKTAEDTKLSHLRKDGADSVLLFAGASVGTALGLNLLLELLGLTAQSNVYQAVRTEQYAASFLIGLLTYGLIAPVAEELLFRGVIHNYLRRLFAPKQALFISAALFGVYHMNYVQGIYGFLLGGLIAYGYEYFGKFRAALLMHAGVNLLVYSISYAAGRDNAAWLVNWPVCLVMAALAGGCLWAISRKKNVW